MRCLLLCVAALFLTGCPPMAPYTPPPPLQPISYDPGPPAGAYPSAVGTMAAAPSDTLLVYGGADHKTFLGCLTCSRYEANAIANQYGDFGSRYSPTSIANHYSEFGSAFSADSACNNYANDPPVIVRPDGQYFGRLTLNQYHPQLAGGRWFIESLRKLCA